MAGPTHLLLLASFSLLVPGTSVAQKADVRAEALRDLNDMKSTMVNIAQAMPEATFGEQILHVADANVVWTTTLGSKATPPTVNPNATSKAEIIQALEASFDYAVSAISEQTPDSMLEQVKMPWSGELESRLHVAYSMVSHAWDIYGQLAVYLRLNDHIPPASQGL